MPQTIRKQREKWRKSGSTSGAQGSRKLSQILLLFSPKVFPEGRLSLITEFRNDREMKKSKVRIFFDRMLSKGEQTVIR